MAYLQTQDFKAGMDRTRGQYVGVPGALWDLKNGHITRGGDIEGMKKFVSKYTLPAGTFGMAQVRGQLYTFGSADLAASMPAGVTYQRLTLSGSPAMEQVLDARARDDKLFVIAKFAGGIIANFYNGTEVTAWNARADANYSRSALGQFMAELINSRTDVTAQSSGDVIQIEAVTAGTAFTISASYDDGGSANDENATVATPQANVAAVVEVRASGSITVTGGTANAGVNKISSVLVNAVELLDSEVDWTGSNASTAIQLAASINNASSVHGYTATIVSSTVTLRAAVGTGATPNGHVITVVTGGDVVATNDATVTGGVTAVTAVAQISTVTLSGTSEALDVLTVTINATAYVLRGRSAGTATSSFIWKSRMWATANTLFAYSKTDDPTLWADADDGGFINMANQTEGTERLVVAEEYNGSVAIFARGSVRIWSLDVDPDNNIFLQTLDNTGTVAPKSVKKYGSQDVYYAADSGFRSLRARDASGTAVAEDIGVNIDPFVQEFYMTVTPAQIERACAIIEPVDNRYLCAIGGRIFVFSYFSSKKISAWSYYEPGIDITDFVRVRRKLYARAGDVIYLYGGNDGTTYPDDGETATVVETSFVSAGTAATDKKFMGFDLAAVNQWDVKMLTDPEDTTKEISVGQVVGVTYNKGRIGVPGQGAISALKATCSGAGRRVLSASAVHFVQGEAG